MSSMAELVYGVVLRLPSGKSADGGLLRRGRKLREDERIEHDGQQWLVDHIVADCEPPLAYLVLPPKDRAVRR